MASAQKKTVYFGGLLILCFGVYVNYVQAAFCPVGFVKCTKNGTTICCERASTTCVEITNWGPSCQCIDTCKATEKPCCKNGGSNCRVNAADCCDDVYSKCTAGVCLNSDGCSRRQQPCNNMKTMKQDLKCIAKACKIC